MAFFKKNDKKMASNSDVKLVEKLLAEIMDGPLATIDFKIVSPNIFDGYETSTYEDDVLILSRNKAPYGKANYGASWNIELKNHGTVYDGVNAYDLELWYDHLVGIYSKSIEVKKRKVNLKHKVIHICDYVESGYSDGIISVEYEKSVKKNFDETKSFDLYTCKIFLIPLGEYVYVTDMINHELPEIARVGKWVGYVSGLVDKFEAEKRAEKEALYARRKAELEIQKTLKKIKDQSKQRPIDDSHLFN